MPLPKESNVINTQNESGDAPIRYIQNVNPIVIIDEPQNMETDIRRHAIASLNPLFTLRYSATHKTPITRFLASIPCRRTNFRLSEANRSGQRVGRIMM